MGNITKEEEERMIERYREEYGIEPIDDSIDYKQVLVTGAVLATDPELTENYKKLNDSLHCDEYHLCIHSPLATMKFKGTDEEKYVRAMELVGIADVVIAEMSNVSTGQGMELQEATRLGKSILVIAKTGSKISGLIKGCPNVRNILFYDDIYDITNDINKFIKEELELIYRNNEGTTSK